MEDCCKTCGSAIGECVKMVSGCCEACSHFPLNDMRDAADELAEWADEADEYEYCDTDVF